MLVDIETGEPCLNGPPVTEESVVRAEDFR